MIERMVKPATLLLKAFVVFGLAGSYYTLGSLFYSGATRIEWLMVAGVTLGATLAAIAVVRQNI